MFPTPVSNSFVPPKFSPSPLPFLVTQSPNAPLLETITAPPLEFISLQETIPVPITKPVPSIPMSLTNPVPSNSVESSSSSSQAQSDPIPLTNVLKLGPVTDSVKVLGQGFRSRG